MLEDVKAGGVCKRRNVDYSAMVKARWEKQKAKEGM